MSGVGVIVARALPRATVGGRRRSVRRARRGRFKNSVGRGASRSRVCMQRRSATIRSHERAHVNRKSKARRSHNRCSAARSARVVINADHQTPRRCTRRCIRVSRRGICASNRSLMRILRARSSSVIHIRHAGAYAHSRSGHRSRSGSSRRCMNNGLSVRSQNGSVRSGERCPRLVVVIKGRAAQPAPAA